MSTRHEGMTPLQRIEAAFSLGTPDRTATLGGWIACPRHIMELTGASEDDYWENPREISIQAYRKLGVDALMDVFVPASRHDYRCVDPSSHDYRSPSETDLEDALVEVDAMPGPEKIESGFDFDARYCEYRSSLEKMRAICGDIVWMPANWRAGARLSWYQKFGYENFFLMVGAYPERAQKLLEIGGAEGRCTSMLVAKAVREGLLPHAVLLGEDICTQRGPMVSVDFLEKYYFPQLRYGLEPLLEAGCRPVWHCDGDVRLILDGLIECGVKGLQGFQTECGVLLKEIVERRTRDGEPLLIFGPLAVTTELPVLTPEQIGEKVRSAIEMCRGKASLVIFTSNTINPDVPLANVIAMYEAAKNSTAST